MGQLTYTAYVGEQPLKEAIEAAKGWVLEKATGYLRMSMPLFRVWAKH